jgi:hypothetical protein
MSNPSNTKRTYPICDTPAARWSRRYVDVRPVTFAPRYNQKLRLSKLPSCALESG